MEAHTETPPPLSNAVGAGVGGGIGGGVGAGAGAAAAGPGVFPLVFALQRVSVTAKLKIRIGMPRDDDDYEGADDGYADPFVIPGRYPSFCPYTADGFRVVAALEPQPGKVGTRAAQAAPYTTAQATIYRPGYSTRFFGARAERALEWTASSWCKSCWLWREPW